MSNGPMNKQFDQDSYILIILKLNAQTGIRFIKKANTCLKIVNLLQLNDILLVKLQAVLSLTHKYAYCQQKCHSVLQDSSMESSLTMWTVFDLS